MFRVHADIPQVLTRMLFCLGGDHLCTCEYLGTSEMHRAGSNFRSFGTGASEEAGGLADASEERCTPYRCKIHDQTPCEIDALPEFGIWVQYFTRGLTFYSAFS